MGGKTYLKSISLHHTVGESTLWLFFFSIFYYFYYIIICFTHNFYPHPHPLPPILVTTRDPRHLETLCRDSEFERKSSPRDKRPLETGVSRGVRGHASPGNFEILSFGNAIFSIPRGESKWVNCCKFKSIFCFKKNNYADNVDTGGDPENWSVCCCERLR